MTANATETMDLTDLESLLDAAKEQVLNGTMAIGQLRWFNSLTFDDRESLMEDVEDAAEEARSTPILHPIAQGLTIEADDGKEPIPVSEVFSGGIYGYAVDWDADSGPTGEIKTTVHEMRKDAIFKKMFNSLSTDTKRLCLTRRQIKKFVQKHRQHLRKEGFATFFLFKSKGKFLVANVCFNDAGHLEVYVYHFENDSVWYAGYRHRVVIPRLETV